MRVHVDLELLRATAPPLRQSAAVVDELSGVRAQLRSGAVPAVGDELLDRALTDFMTAWSDGLAAAGERGRTLAGMLERAAEHYGHTDRGVHRAGQ